MAKIFEFSGGSYIDKVSGVVGTPGSSASFIKSEKGISANFDNDANARVDYSSYVDLGGNDFTIELCFLLHKGWNSIDYVTIIGDSNYNSQRIVIRNNNNIYIQDNDGTIAGFSFTPKSAKWYHLIIIRDVVNDTMYAYINGELLSTSTTWDGTSTYKFNRIGYSSTQYPMIGKISKVAAYNHILTDIERANLYQEFLRSAPTTKDIYVPATYPKPFDLSSLVDSRIGNPDADLTVMNVSDCVNNDYTTFSDASPTGFTVVSDGSSAQEAGTADEITVIAGKKIRISFNMVLNSGTAPYVDLVNNFSGSSYLVGGQKTAVNGENHFVVTPNADGTVICQFKNSSTATSYTISDLSIKEWDGEELVPDSDVGFVANDIDTWGVYGTNTKEQDGNAVKATYVDNSFGIYLLLNAVTSTFSNQIIGQKYRVIFKAKVNSGSVAVNVYRGGVIETTGQFTNTEYQIFTLDYIAVHVTDMALNLSGLSVGESAWIEVLSVKKVSGLVAAYNMIPNDNVLVDISGNGNDQLFNDVGTHNPMSNTDGVMFRDKCYQITELSELSLDKTFTVCTRVKPTDYTRRSQVIWSNGNASDDRKGVTISSGGSVAFDTYVTGYGGLQAVAYAIDNEWINIVAICNGSESLIKLYLDGVEITNSGTNGLLGGGSAAFELGGDGSTRNFIGEIADFAIYNYAFSEQEAVDYHNKFARQVNKAISFSDEGVGNTIG